MAALHNIAYLFVAMLIATSAVFLFFLIRTDVIYNETQRIRSLQLARRSWGDSNATASLSGRPGSVLATRSKSGDLSTTHRRANISAAQRANISNTSSKLRDTPNPSNATGHNASLATSASVASPSENATNQLHANASRDGRNTASKPIFVSDPSKPLICHSFSNGRLGNHLFEYASILGLARSLDRSFFFPSDGRLLKNLKYPPVQNRSKEMQARCKAAKVKMERHLCQFDAQLYHLEDGKDYNLRNYFQSWVYFNGMQDEIRHAVTFSDNIVGRATAVVSDLRAAHPNTTLVGVHNRRGDLASNSWLKRTGYLTAPPEFFQKSMTFFRERFSRVLFLVLGEDKRWNAENIKAIDDDVVFLKPTSSPAVDMQILSMADHMIRTVGTFGWWAAFKMQGRPTVVYLKNFTKKGSSLSKWYSPHAEDYLLPQWIGM